MVHFFRMASGAVIAVEGSPISVSEAVVNGPAWRRTIYENAGGDLVSEAVDQGAAATKISSHMRGFLARSHWRMRAQELREERDRIVAEQERQRRLESERRTHERVINGERHEAERNRALEVEAEYRCGRARVPIHGLRRGRETGNSAGNFCVSTRTDEVLIWGTCFNKGGDQRWGAKMKRKDYCPTSEILSRIDNGKKFLCRCNCDPVDFL